MGGTMRFLGCDTARHVATKIVGSVAAIRGYGRSAHRSVKIALYVRGHGMPGYSPSRPHPARYLRGVE